MFVAWHQCGQESKSPSHFDRYPARRGSLSGILTSSRVSRRRCLRDRVGVLQGVLRSTAFGKWRGVERGGRSVIQSRVAVERGSSVADVYSDEFCGCSGMVEGEPQDRLVWVVHIQRADERRQILDGRVTRTEPVATCRELDQCVPGFHPERHDIEAGQPRVVRQYRRSRRAIVTSPVASTSCTPRTSPCSANSNCRRKSSKSRYQLALRTRSVTGSFTNRNSKEVTQQRVPGWMEATLAPRGVAARP